MVRLALALPAFVPCGVVRPSTLRETRNPPVIDVATTPAANSTTTSTTTTHRIALPEQHFLSLLLTIDRVAAAYTTAGAGRLSRPPLAPPIGTYQYYSGVCPSTAQRDVSINHHDVSCPYGLLVPGLLLSIYSDFYARICLAGRDNWERRRV
jgi:hypothetical protein